MPTGERALAARPLVGGERQRGNIRGDGRGRDLDSMTASVRREEGCRLNGRPTADKSRRFAAELSEVFRILPRRENHARVGCVGRCSRLGGCALVCHAGRCGSQRCALLIGGCLAELLSLLDGRMYHS